MTETAVAARDELVHGLIDSCTTGDLDQLQTYLEQAQNFDSKTMPTPSYLLKIAFRKERTRRTYSLPLPRLTQISPIPAMVARSPG